MLSIEQAKAINLALLFVICLAIGTIAGYFVGEPRPSDNLAGTGLPGAAGSSEVISIENAWIIEGLSCPEPGCDNSLLNCQNALPRQIRTWINARLAAGISGEEITTEVIRAHGKEVTKLGGGGTP